MASASNPVVLSCEGENVTFITCVAHASYYQRVTLEIYNGDETIDLVAEGTGENVPMKFGPGGSGGYKFSSPQGWKMSATFEYSENGADGPFQMAQVQAPIISKVPGMQEIQVTSEDSTDDDDNDTYLTVNSTLSSKADSPASPAVAV